MGTEIVRADWLNGDRYLLRDRYEFPIVMTQPMGVNGSDLLPLSVIGCAAWDIASILRKQRQSFTAMQVTAESTREDDPPWRFLSIHIHYQISGDGLDAKQVERAISLAEDKYCSTFATLRQIVEITSEFSILKV